MTSFPIYNRMNQHRNTKPEPKSIIWSISVQCRLILSHLILNSLKFCEWGKGVGLGENIQLNIKNKNKININLFIELIYINQHNKGQRAAIRLLRLFYHVKKSTKFQVFKQISEQFPNATSSKSFRNFSEKIQKRHRKDWEKIQKRSRKDSL